MHNKLELEVIELNFQLLQVLISSQQSSSSLNDKELKRENFGYDDNIINVINLHLEFAEKLVQCKSKQLSLCGAQIWLKLI